jgi:rubredoxin
MAEPLPPFSGDKPTCPKCGHGDAYTEYRGNGTCVHGGSGGYFGFGPNERLHRQCARCGYAWDEATTDTTTKEK